MHCTTAALAVVLWGANVLAHPGDDLAAEIAERAAFTKFSKKNLDHCAEKFKARGIEEKNLARRAARANHARQKRGISTEAPYLRVRADPIDTDHESPVDYNSDTAADVLFASNGSCILSPEVTQGPYYVEGEYVRENLTENQAGIDLILDAQVVDVTTCEPVTNAMLEIWACNATGVYSGIVASGNGVGTADPSNLNNTALRGLQPTDEDGVASFDTLFPGHYTGRATHIHVMVHFNGTSFDNGTYAGGYVSHVGQLFFDQDLITDVDAVAPYSTNNQQVTANSADMILAEETANGHDPFVSYSLLSTTSDVSQGIFAWISFGIDLTSQETVTGAATLTANGGVENENSGGSGGPGGSGGGGTRGGPGGSRPSGAPGNATAPGSGAGSANWTTSSGAPAGTTTAAGGTSGATTSVISSGLVLLLGVFWFM